MRNAPHAVISVALVSGSYCTSKDYKYMVKEWFHVPRQNQLNFVMDLFFLKTVLY